MFTLGIEKVMNNRIHILIADMFKKLGYNYDNGACYAISLRWQEACLTGEQLIFLKRIAVISELDLMLDLDSFLKEIKNKKGVNLSEKDREVLDVLSFFDSLFLFQNPSWFPDLFTQPTTQQMLGTVSEFASSDSLLAKGGMNKIYSRVGIYTDEELEYYLTKFSNYFMEMLSFSEETVALLLTNHNHTLSVTFKKNQWTFFNINDYPPKVFSSTENKLLMEYIKKGFKRVNSNFTGFNTAVFVTNDKIDKEKLAAGLLSIKGNESITKEIAQRELFSGMRLANLATIHNDRLILSSVLKCDNHLQNTSVHSLVHLAIIQIFPEALLILARNGYDINKRDLTGATPLQLAVAQGSQFMINSLLYLKADTNQINESGQNLLFDAINHRQVSCIPLLIKHIDPHQEDKNGFNSFSWAIFWGYLKEMQEFLKYKNIVENINNPNTHGMTAALFAVLSGEPKIITELLFTIDLNTPSKILLLSLIHYINFMFQYKFHQEAPKEIIFRLEEFSRKQSNPAYLSITPHDLAAIMGYNGIAEIIKTASELDKKNTYKPITVSSHSIFTQSTLLPSMYHETQRSVNYDTP